MDKILLTILIAFIGLVIYAYSAVVSECESKGGVYLNRENVCAKSDNYIKLN